MNNSICPVCCRPINKSSKPINTGMRLKSGKRGTNTISCSKLCSKIYNRCVKRYLSRIKNNKINKNKTLNTYLPIVNKNMRKEIQRYGNAMIIRFSPEEQRTHNIQIGKIFEVILIELMKGGQDGKTREETRGES
jgi:hypothetical protein